MKKKKIPFQWYNIKKILIYMLLSFPLIIHIHEDCKQNEENNCFEKESKTMLLSYMQNIVRLHLIQWTMNETKVCFIFCQFLIVFCCCYWCPIYKITNMIIHWCVCFVYMLFLLYASAHICLCIREKNQWNENKRKINWLREINIKIEPHNIMYGAIQSL